MLAVETDGMTLVNILADPTTHALHVGNGTTGSDNGPSQSRHDDSHVSILMAVSSADGKTPVALYGDSSGNLLVQIT